MTAQSTGTTPVRGTHDMKKLILIVALLFPLLASAQRYVGTFVGNGLALTNIPSGALRSPITNNIIVNGNVTLTGKVIGNGASLSNLPITAIWGSGGTNTVATNGTSGQTLLSAANGGVYWGTASGSGGLSNVVENASGVYVKTNLYATNSITVVRGANSSQTWAISQLSDGTLSFDSTSGDQGSFNGRLKTQGTANKIATKVASFPLDSTSGVVIFNGTTLTATLPDAGNLAGQIYTIKNINASPLTIATTSGQTIDGTTPVALTTGQSRTYICDGSNWFIIGGYL